jgi:hypothetical protein
MPHELCLLHDEARFTRSVGNRREWMSNEDIVTLVLWRDPQSSQWRRFTRASIIHDWMVDNWLMDVCTCMG